MDVIKRTGVASGMIALVLYASIAHSAFAIAKHESRKRLNFDEAKEYLLTLINQDRERQGLKPVQMDAIAAAAGQKHAEEMAVNRYLSHWNKEGKLPDQRYTEAGGKDHVS